MSPEDSQGAGFFHFLRPVYRVIRLLSAFFPFPSVTVVSPDDKYKDQNQTDQIGNAEYKDQWIGKQGSGLIGNAFRRRLVSCGSGVGVAVTVTWAVPTGCEL